MKTYVDKMTIWHEGKPQVIIECDDGCSRVEFHNHYWNSETWLLVSREVFNAIKRVEAEQRELDQDVA